ncbi:MAG: hypothetical protein LIO56_05085 [Lachnospiraceae bacterium]|nr:hypothetical protein [Lachnospiraceae bacterium]
MDVTTINEEEVPLSVEMEEENLSEGTLTLHSIWHDAAGSGLSSVNIAFYEDEELIFSGTTGEDGALETCTLPCNTVLFCSVTDEAGLPLAESDLVIKLSEDYTALTIYPTKEATEEEEVATECVIEIPIDKTDVRASIFVTEDGAISFASLTIYMDEAEAAAEDAEAEAENAEEAAAEEEVVEEEVIEEAEDAEEAAEEATEEAEDEEENHEDEDQPEDEGEGE